MTGINKWNKFTWMFILCAIKSPLFFLPLQSSSPTSSSKLTSRRTTRTLFKKRILFIFSISLPSLSLLPPLASCLFVHKCVCMTLSCEAESQADSRACWQGNTAGRLITAHGRQALTGASPLLTSHWHQMLCVYSHVQVLVYVSVRLSLCIGLRAVTITNIRNERARHSHSRRFLIHSLELHLSMGNASSWHCSILWLAAVSSSNTRWQHVHTEIILLASVGTFRLQWQCFYQGWAKSYKLNAF